ncbi:helix-turn-helix domain-containing protein [Streptomyces sp. DSM 41014]|uniref:Helix-turn-helix domain-containing protein n=1 Tax=Streptomyces hintoniae TaxID=3075521 RepID=A0ABU2UWA8_9ACTN|nr:helix-turn-helix domain-containing protein [Streptomyces sp. DSM 41014]MDT0477418.1 helix-turn-helix domain-containing protein [Streptomyces sp. DSM 41014]
MNTTVAAIHAQVSVPTIRAWCRTGVITAAKTAGRWIIDTASLAHRIAIGAMRARKAKPMALAPLTRAEFEQEAAKLGIRSTFKDTRCHGEYLAYQATGAPYDDTPYQWLLIRRGATLAAEHFTPQVRTTHSHECLTCGLDTRTCDCR